MAVVNLGVWFVLHVRVKFEWGATFSEDDHLPSWKRGG